MRPTAGVIMLLVVLASASTGIAQVVPSSVACKTLPEPPASAMAPKSPTLQDVQNSKGAQLIAAPNSNIAPDPCSGFSNPQMGSGDAVLMEDATKEITQNGIQAAVSNAAGIQPELPTNAYADGLSLASQSTAFFLRDGALKEVLATTLPELLASPWVTGGLGATLNSSTTESGLQNRTGQTDLVYHRLLDVARQMNVATSALERSQLIAACERLRSALLIAQNQLTSTQVAQTNQVLSACAQILATPQSTVNQVSPLSPPRYQPAPNVTSPAKPQTGSSGCPIGAKVCH